MFIFDASKASVGEIVAGLKISKLEVVDEIVAFVSFEGTVTISGVYKRYEEDHVFLGNSIGFTVDEQSLGNLPKLKNDERHVWFVFDNEEVANEMFGEGMEGVATIEIKNYVINYAPTEVYNTATLISIKK